jgi:hypothetical protein
MKTAAEHHLSGDTLLMLSVAVGLLLGGGAGWLLGTAMANIGMGVTIGATGGLIVGLVAGIFLSDRAES